jgi:hypothetical protein
MNKKIGISNFYLSVVICTICSSCSCHITPQYVKDYFNYCYDGAYTGIDTLINIEGYYEPHLMFYKDGTCINGFMGIWRKTIQEQFEEMVNAPREMKVFHWDNNWGCYVICGDTIKVRTVKRAGCGGMDAIWWLDEKWFKIIDKNTLEKIYPTYSGLYLTKFHSLTVRPNSDCSLKKKKWFWCNEELYKEYKRTLKKSRK